MLQVAKAILLIVHRLSDEIIYYVGAHWLFRWLPFDVDGSRVLVKDLYQVHEDCYLTGEDFIDQFYLLLGWSSCGLFTFGCLLWFKALAHSFRAEKLLEGGIDKCL